MDSASSRNVLELRIHGVKNTLPHEMLGVKASEVTQVRGDELGGFWATSEETEDTPKNVHREAYSWGLLARTGGGALPFIGQLAVHIGWLFILPFGLCNVAYWTRRLEAQPDPRIWIPGRGAAALRVFGLGLTLFFVTALSSVALDLLALDCFRADPSAEPDAPLRCAPLSAVLTPLEALGRDQRLALLALLPLAAMVFIYLLARRGRVTYEASVNSLAKSLSRKQVEALPVLATPGFWALARIGQTTERLHVAAVLLLLALLLAWDQVYWSTTECTAASTFLQNGCLWHGEALGSSWVSAAVVALAAAALAVVVWKVVRASETPTGAQRRRKLLDSEHSGDDTDELQAREVRRLRAFAGGLLAFGAALFAAAFLIGILRFPGERARAAENAPSLLGLTVAPQLLLAVLLAIALAGLGWRRHQWPLRKEESTGAPSAQGRAVPYRARSPRPSLEGSLLAATLILVIASHWLPGILGVVIPPAIAVIGVVLFLLILLLRGRGEGIEAGRMGWRGTAPGVVLILSLGSELVLTSALVVGMRFWLGIGDRRSNDIYAEFGAVLLVILALLAPVVAAVLTWNLIKLPQLRSARVREGRKVIAPLLEYDGKKPPVARTGDRIEVLVLRARRFAALAHRVEPLLGVVAFLLALGVLAVVLVDTQPVAPGEQDETVLGWMLTAAPAALGAAALAALSLVAANALTHKERPVGVLWDLICFLPRAGHPFGPPSYAERVVPEIEGRVREWLDTRSEGRRRVVLSAHSLGAVLAIATLFARYAIEEKRLRNVGLITFGTQTRPYFGRFFPELFGPRVLGVRSCLGPSLLRRDPWIAQIGLDDREDPETFEGSRIVPTLCELLTTKGTAAWVNIWRRTDFLGFPVHSYRNFSNPVDRGTSELETGLYEKVATHSNYPEAVAYSAAFTTLLSRI